MVMTSWWLCAVETSFRKTDPCAHASSFAWNKHHPEGSSSMVNCAVSSVQSGGAKKVFAMEEYNKTPASRR